MYNVKPEYPESHYITNTPYILQTPHTLLTVHMLLTLRADQKRSDINDENCHLY